MNPQEIKRIQEIVKLNRLLRSLKQIREITQGAGRDGAVQEWLHENRGEIKDLPAGHLNQLREACEYDAGQWNRILQQLSDDA